MAKAAQKLVKKVDRMPSCYIKVGREEFKGTPSLGMLVQQGQALKQEMDVYKKKLEAVNEKIVERIVGEFLEDTGTAHVVASGIDCTVALRESVVISDADGLRDVLGDRFGDLVTEKTTYKPERKLVSMACDGDGKDRDVIAKCLTVKEAKPSVTYKVM